MSSSLRQRNTITCISVALLTQGTKLLIFKSPLAARSYNEMASQHAVLPAILTTYKKQFKKKRKIVIGSRAAEIVDIIVKS